MQEFGGSRAQLVGKSGTVLRDSKLHGQRSPPQGLQARAYGEGFRSVEPAFTGTGVLSGGPPSPADFPVSRDRTPDAKFLAAAESGFVIQTFRRETKARLKQAHERFVTVSFERSADA